MKLVQQAFPFVAREESPPTRARRERARQSAAPTARPARALPLDDLAAHPSRDAIIEGALSEPQQWAVRGTIAGRSRSELATERGVTPDAVGKMISRAAVEVGRALRSRLHQAPIRFERPAARVIPLAKKSPVELQAEWEAKLAAEKMPAELPEREMPHPVARVEFLASTPRRRVANIARPRFSGHEGHGEAMPAQDIGEEKRREPAPSMGAWWTDTADDEESAGERWGRISEEVRPIIERALRTAGAGEKATRRERGTKVAAVYGLALVAAFTPLDEEWDRRILRAARRMAVRMERARQVAERAKQSEILTGPQGVALRLWLVEGMRKVDIAKREGHSKVTIHWKIKRATDRLAAHVRAVLGEREST